MNDLYFPSFLAAGILTDAFGKLFGVIWNVIKWIGNLIRNLFQGFIDVIIDFFEVMYALVDGLLYFIFKIAILAVKLFQIFFEIAKLIWALITGLSNTLVSLSYTPQTSSQTGYSEILGTLFSNLSYLQIDVIAYILLFIMWMTTAVSAIKLLSSIRVGGE